MAKHLQLTIADPCHEDWNKMTDTGKGKFCGSCQKQVIDFTGMTDMQLASFFKKQSTESICGRFNDDQLDREIAVPRKRIPWIKYFFQFSFPLFLTSCKLNAQKGKVAVTTVQTESCERRNYGNVMVLADLPDMSVDQGVQVKGVVQNEEGHPVPFASIEKGLVGTAADSSGAFSLILAPNSKGIKLTVSSVGYKSKEVALSGEQITGKEKIIITLNKAGELEPVTVNSELTTKMGGLIGGLIVRRRRFHPPVKPMPITTFKIYANPVVAGSNIFIKPEKTDPGQYSIQLLTISGQLIKQEVTSIEKGKGVFSFAIPAIPSGTYLVNLQNKKTGAKYAEKLIVQ